MQWLASISVKRPVFATVIILSLTVIGAFSFSDVLFMKMIGVGMLVAIAVDATVVRALLVPATMKLLGSWNWWAPGPLRRWWERYGFREEARAVTPAGSEGAEPSSVQVPQLQE